MRNPKYGGRHRCIRNSVLTVTASLVPIAFALAHHSYAMFDTTKELALKGTVKKFYWTNPHSAIEIDVPNTAGSLDTWGVECNSPNNLARMGWKSTSLKPGDKVTIVIHPLRSGEHGGSFLYVIYPDGRRLGETSGATNGHPGKDTH
jgi:Family of unknown function (DUF6152)